MGDVYRARDARLSRDVAVKVLPAALAADRDRLARFELEAQALAALNHPNILGVYDVGTLDSVPYVVSELLEGETLRERLSGSPLPARKALDFAVQLAHGLAAAHDKGIVHRDLKPENVFVTRDGRVKILDFGLAKLLERPAEGAAREREEAPTSGRTDPGVVLGTAEYMSPEQCRGRAADHRSDIFSLGVVLYEMLTGQRCFQRETPADTMSAILREDPPAPSALAKGVPPTLDAIVAHCIEKPAEERFQSARDLAFDLEAVARGWISSSTALPVVTPPRRLGRLPVRVGLGVVAGLVLGLAAGGWLERRPPPSYRRLTFRRGVVTSARFAPGGTIVYSAAWEGRPGELFMARPEGTESRSLELPPGDVLAISNDGEMALSLDRHYLRGFVYSGTLARAPLAGGVPRPVLDGVQAADWSADGKSLAIVRDVKGKSRIELPVDTVLYASGGYVSHPRISPDGRHVAFIEHPIHSDDGGSVAVVDRSGTKKTLSGGWLTAAGLAWSRDGREVWFTGAKVGGARALYAASLSGAERVVDRIAGTLTLHDIAPDGRVLLARDDLRREILGVPPGETRERSLSWLDWSRATDLSADGRLLLFSEQGEGGGMVPAVYLRRTDGSPAVRLGEGISTELSPDGKWALALETASPTQITLLPTGTGAPRPLTHDAINHHWATWHPDGARIVFSGNEPGRGTRLYVQNLEGGAPRAFTPEGVRSVWHPIAPDGQAAAAVLAEGSASLYPIDGGEPQPILGFLPGERPVRWSGDGRWLYVFRQGEVPARVNRIELATGRRDVWKELMPPDPAGVNLINPVLLTPDAKAYVYSYRRILSDLYLVEGLR
jgi:Tol biopolymer transport system component